MPKNLVQVENKDVLELRESFITQKACASNESELTQHDIEIYIQTFCENINQLVDSFSHNPLGLAKTLIVLADKCNQGNDSSYLAICCKTFAGPSDLDPQKRQAAMMAIEILNAVAVQHELSSRGMLHIIPSGDNQKNVFSARGELELRELLGQCLETAINKMNEDESFKKFFGIAKVELEKPSSSISYPKIKQPSASTSCAKCVLA